MPAARQFKALSNGQQFFWILIFALIIFTVTSSRTLAGGLVNQNQATASEEVTALSEVDDHRIADRADLAIVPERDGAVRWTPERILKEVGKQAVDQPGHFLIGAAPIWASRYLVGVPWLGWVAAPILAYREWLQWPSRRWWDPPLDWAFLTLGALAATWRRRPGQRRPGGSAALRRSLASGLAIRDRVPHRA